MLTSVKVLLTCFVGSKGCCGYKEVVLTLQWIFRFGCSWDISSQLNTFSHAQLPPCWFFCCPVAYLASKHVTPWIPFGLLHRAYLHLGKNPTWYISWWAHLYHVPACVCVCHYLLVHLLICTRVDACVHINACVACDMDRNMNIVWFLWRSAFLSVSVYQNLHVCVCTDLHISGACVPPSSSALLAVV